jgi:osmotically-inducible protein OsmY
MDAARARPEETAMIRMLVKFVLVVVVVVGLAAFFLGWWTGGVRQRAEPSTAERGGGVDNRAREIGGDIGEATARAAGQARDAAADGSITAKIKSKMALDEQVRARDIDVDTSNGLVTLSGVVRSAAERDRALRLARETEGVTEVQDRLRID